MTAPPSSASKDVQDALAALERLLTRHKLVTPEQATLAARIITGDETYVFPPPPAQRPSEGASDAGTPTASPS